jgi:hypothetical protein
MAVHLSAVALMGDSKFKIRLRFFLCDSVNPCAPALGAHHPNPTAQFPTLTSLCFQ